MWSSAQNYNVRCGEASTSGAMAQKHYDTGATDSEIKIGNIMPCSGPASAYGVIGRTMKAFLEFLAKDFPEGNKLDNNVVTGFSVAQTLVQVLKQCGDDLTRDNVMKQAASLKDFRTEMLLPGIKINTSPTDFAPISQQQLQRFTGERWELFGDVISADVGG